MARLFRRLLIAGLLAAVLLGVLFATAPAALLYRVAAGRLQPLALEGVSGSLWQGQAEVLVVQGVALGKFEWRLSAVNLLRGLLLGELRVSGSELQASAQLGGTTVRPQLTQVQAHFPAAVLAPALGLPQLNLLGTVELQFATLELANGLPAQADGVARWQELGLSGVTEARLPGIEARFGSPTPGRIQAQINDLGGPLAISGTALIEGEHYRSETRLALREENPQLAQALTFIGERAADGATILRIHGQLQKLP